ncbi:hypothetical protein HDA40_000859 [Hamadaea flava]|uniref:SCO6045-like C-terminal domain-containing protein n=1 Tax=Hamadaea flava TaxID=1742688 RepID=A0ABV8LPS6_9ACTN|nr:hypothetical protein [Hamadaea flava]MCP2322352.1 hypothetical protein [Hamadaea flava]
MSLADRQAALVAALVAGGSPPPGFDTGRVDAVREQLLRKRAGEVGRAWPALAASLGPTWYAAFRAWADGRPPQGSLRDGWDLARSLSTLDRSAQAELRSRDAHWSYDGLTSPRRRSPLARLLRSAIIRFGKRSGRQGHDTPAEHDR